MSERFFSETPIDGEEAMLAGAEAHHLMHVMRASPGDRVTLFDGSGAEFDAQVQLLTRRDATLSILNRREIDREASCDLSLGVALPKGDRQKVLVEKLTELGVASLTPLVTERSIAEPKVGALDKLRRHVIEACKQCGRNRLMRINAPARLEDFLASDWGDSQRLFAHPEGQGIDAFLAQSVRKVCTIGPEGGFSDQEVDMAVSNDWKIISFGPRVLRIETAAIAMAAIADNNLAPG